MENNGNYGGQPQYDNQMYNPNPAPAQGSSDNSVLYGVLAYLPLLWLIGLLCKPESETPFVKNHVNNGIRIDIVSLGLGIILGIFALIFALMHVGFIITILSWLIFIGMFVLRIVGIINAAQKTNFELPLIGGKIVLVK